MTAGASVRPSDRADLDGKHDAVASVGRASALSEVPGPRVWQAKTTTTLQPKSSPHFAVTSPIFREARFEFAKGQAFDSRCNMKRAFEYAEAIAYVGAKRRTFDLAVAPRLVEVERGAWRIFDREGHRPCSLRRHCCSAPVEVAAHASAPDSLEIAMDLCRSVKPRQAASGCRVAPTFGRARRACEARRPPAHASSSGGDGRGHLRRPADCGGDPFIERVQCAAPRRRWRAIATSRTLQGQSRISA